MQRFFTLVALLLFALPVGLSVTGCVTNRTAFCNDAGYGTKTTAITSVQITGTLPTTGISLAYGQTGPTLSTQAYSCTNVKLSTGGATWGSSNLQLADISPTGTVCAGTWNRLSQGGIPDFTICTPPTQSGIATVTASVGGVVSNPVTVYVHPQISAISITNPTSCFSSGTATPTTDTLVQQTSVYGTDGALLPSQGSGNVVGTITYTAETPSVVTINNTSIVPASGTPSNDPNGYAVANQPGGTVITATIAGASANAPATSSAAGYFYTCPPVSIKLCVPSSANPNVCNSTGPTTITAKEPQSIVATLVDQNNTAITPIANTGPDYVSNQPQQISVNAAGLVTPLFPGTATLTGICQPGTVTASTSSTASAAGGTTGQSCNPTPLNKVGTFGTGLPIVGNPLTVNTPGTESTLLWAASPQSQYFTPFDLNLSSSGSPVLLPYPPNSMVLDPTGTNLYFGSYRELMTYNASSNAQVGSGDTTVPGVVLAVAPADNQVVIADQLRQVIYLYTPAVTSTTPGATTASSNISIGGLATHAVYSPDGKNVYIIGPTTLYVHNIVSGWSQYPLTSANATTSCALDNTGSTPFCSPDIALTVPSVAAFLSGNPVTARSFCPDTTTTPVTFNPLAATLTGSTVDHLAATPDGNHILGASTTQITDIEHSPTSDASPLIAPVGPCPGVVTGTAGPLGIATTLRQLALSGITPAQIDQVLASPDSSRAFVLYMADAASGLLPMYTLSTTAGGGTLTNIQLGTGALAPIAGVFSPDSSSFFVSTTGDNLIHVLNTTTLKDTEQLNPQLTGSGGHAVPAQFLASKPRSTT